METYIFRVSTLPKSIFDKTTAKKRWSLPKIIFLEVETTFRYTFPYSNLQCLPPGDPKVLCAQHGYPVTGKSFIIRRFQAIGSVHLDYSLSPTGAHYKGNGLLSRTIFRCVRFHWKFEIVRFNCKLFIIVSKLNKLKIQWLIQKSKLFILHSVSDPRYFDLDSSLISSLIACSFVCAVLREESCKNIITIF